MNVNVRYIKLKQLSNRHIIWRRPCRIERFLRLLLFLFTKFRLTIGFRIQLQYDVCVTLLLCVNIQNIKVHSIWFLQQTSKILTIKGLPLLMEYLLKYKSTYEKLLILYKSQSR